MKVGLSLSRCLRDIVEGKVLFEDVLVVIARTDVDPNDDNHWQQIFEGYLYGGMSNPEWAGMEDEEENLRHVLRQLHKHGKLHQPRQFGAHPARMPYYWLDCVVPENEHNPAQQKAWDNYKMITGLS
jgi:cytochrome oxidase Cu insertion factor (SCO1/SenC/PrrC family)